MAEVILTDEQRQAVERSGSILVGAAAGSGKTFVLTERVARILSDREHPVKASRLLILTFSNAAASEMRQKIRKKLSEMISEKPDDGFLREQQRLLRRAHIGTVHSFCQKLLREFFSEAGISPDFSLCDDTYSSNLRNLALEESFDALCGEDPESAEILAGNFGRSRSAREAMDAVLSFHMFEENLVDAEKWEDEVLGRMGSGAAFISTPAADALAARLADEFGQIRLLMDDSVRMLDGRGASGKGYEYLCALRDHCAASERLFRGRQWDLAASLVSAKPEGRLTFQKETDEETKTKARAAKKEYDKIQKKAAKIISDDLDASEEARAAQYRIAEALIRAERCFRRTLSRIKNERNMLEYGDLELLVIRLLYDREGKLTELAGSVSERYDHVMVDEFQDTNERQKLIFDAVSSQGKNLFCVGDVKQSIYSFRKADPGIFTRMRDSGTEEDGPEYVALHSNFRSERQVIEAVNRVFDPLMTSVFGGVDYMPDERLVYGGETGAGSEDGSGMEYHAVNCTTEELPDAVAGYVAGLLSGGYMIHAPEGERRVREEDVCILLRAVRGRADLYTAALGKRGIRSASTVSEDYFKASEIMTAMALLRCVDNPGSDMDLAAVMLSPIGRFTVDELASLRLTGMGDRLWNTLKNSSVPKCTGLAELISGLRVKASSMSAEEIVREAIEVTEAEVYLTSPPDTARRKARLRALIGFAGDYTAFGGNGLSDFIRMCDAAAERGGGPEVPQGASGGVLVTSVHKAKGLEWPVVILADAGRELNTSADSGGNVLFDQKVGIAAKVRTETDDGAWMNRTPEYGVISDMKTESGKAEELRILYVALTRAKQKVAVFAARKDTAAGTASDASVMEEAAACTYGDKVIPLLVSSKNRYSDWIAQAFGVSGFSSSDLERGASVRGALSLIRKEAGDYDAGDIAGITDEHLSDPGLTEEINRRLSFVYKKGDTVRIPTSITVTQLTESYRPARSRRPAFVRAGRLTASERGTALHEFMQHCDLKAAAADPEMEAQRLKDMQFLTEQEAGSISAAAVKSFFEGRLGKGMLSADRLYREYPYMDSVKAGEVIQDVGQDHYDDLIIIQGTADCVIEKDGELTVLDYKTDRVDDPEELRRRYSGQLRAYSRSIGSRLGMPVSEAVIWSFELGCEVMIDI